jgi:hypothetical protein
MRTQWQLLAVVIGVALLIASQDSFGRPGGGRAGGAPRGASGPGPGGAGPGAGGPASVAPRSAPPGDRSTQGPHQAASASTRSRDALQKWSANQPKPFSPAWYANHPNAWQATHPHADVAAALTVAGVATWLGVPYASTIVETPATTTTVVTTEAAPPSPAQAPTETTSVETPPDGQWMPLGSFTLKPAGQREATRAINLSVSPDGVVRGSCFDLITDDAYDVRGTVNKKDLRISWTIGKNGKVQFYASVDELTKPEGVVTASYPDGRSAAWQVNALAK